MMQKNRAGRLLPALMAVFAFTQIHAQQITGTIVGTVKDQTGALVTTATVKAINVDTGFSRFGADQ